MNLSRDTHHAVICSPFCPWPYIKPHACLWISEQSMLRNISVRYWNTSALFSPHIYQNSNFKGTIQITFLLLWELAKVILYAVQCARYTNLQGLCYRCVLNSRKSCKNAAVIYSENVLFGVFRVFSRRNQTYKLHVFFHYHHS